MLPHFHLIAAAFVRCNLMLGTAYEQAFENLQYLTCLFSAVSLLLQIYTVDLKVT